jgi:hypothetical protein
MGRVCTTHREKLNAWEILVGKPGEKRPLGKHRPRCEDNIQTDLRQIEWRDMGCIHLAQDKDHL